MKKYIITFVITLILLFIAKTVKLLWTAAGKQPYGERLARCEQSPQWRDGEFRNQYDTPAVSSDKGTLRLLWEYLFQRVDGLSPAKPLPVVKTNLLDLPRNEDICLWLGHSTVFLQTGGVRFLFDPVLTNKLPVWFFMRPFKATDTYTPDDMPDIDYLVITHDHWDHLDWKTVTALKNRVKHVVCGLGIGSHFEYWGFPESRIQEMDWQDSLYISPEMTLRCLPTRHFSGRLTSRNRTLWASYLIDAPRRIFISGDGGYDDRFKRIAEKYPGIDLAIMENGQYNEAWRYIHTLPDELPTAIDELGAKRVLTYHNSKYALAKHAWKEPLDSIYKNAQGKAWQLLTPRMGEPVYLNRRQTFKKWW